MAHNERRSSPLREGGIAIFTGAIYGAVHTLSGHPLDNIKAKLQLDAAYHGKSMLATVKKMSCEGGVGSFWRGCVPPLWGSAVYRSIMMSSYEASFTFFEQNTAENSFWRREYCFGVVRPLVVASTVICSLCRCIAESPIEQAKVMGQLGQTWHFSTLYRGLLEQTLRTTVMLAFIFVPYDYARRESQLFKSLYGQAAIVTAVCGGAYAVGWPFETMKNLRQAGLPSPKATFSQRIAYVGGPLGLFRGAVPGIACGGPATGTLTYARGPVLNGLAGLRNGCAMLAMNGVANPLATRLGLRD